MDNLAVVGNSGVPGSARLVRCAGEFPGQATAVPVVEEFAELEEVEDELEVLDDEPDESLDLDSLGLAAGSVAVDEPLRLSVR